MFSVSVSVSVLVLRNGTKKALFSVFVSHCEIKERNWLSLHCLSSPATCLLPKKTRMDANV